MEFRNSLDDKLDRLAEHFPFIELKHIIFCGEKIVNVDVMIDDKIKRFADFKGRPSLFTSPHNLLISEYEGVDNEEQVLAKINLVEQDCIRARIWLLESDCLYTTRIAYVLSVRIC